MTKAHEMYQDALDRAWLDEKEHRALDREMWAMLLLTVIGVAQVEDAVDLYDRFLSMRPVSEGKRAILRRRFRAAVEDLVSEAAA